MNSRHVARMTALLCTLSLLAGCSTPTSDPAPAPPATRTDPTTTATAACKTASDEEQEVIQWLAANAKPLLSVAPGAETADLQPLKQILDGVRVVGLGEGSHGTHEHFTMKHRLLEFLVKEMGYRTFAMEASYTAGLAVNRYLQTGEGDPKEVLRGLGFWTWDTEEVLAMLTWMRAYNESAPTDQRLQFVGFDVQVVDSGVALLYQYLEAVHPEELDRFKWHLDELRLSTMTMRERDAEYKETHLKELKALADLIERDLGAPPSAPIDSVTAHKVAVNLYRYYEAIGVPTDDVTSSARRDAYMAETIGDLLAELGPTGKIVLWAHNGHVADAEPWMGSHLRKQLGDAYYVLGLELHRGSIRIIENQNQRRITGPGPLTIGEPPRESLQWVLNCAGLGNSLIDLRSSAKSPAFEAWQARKRPFWWFGAVIETKSPTAASQFLGRLTDFDGMIYIPESTAARPN